MKKVFVYILVAIIAVTLAVYLSLEDTSFPKILKPNDPEGKNIVSLEEKVGQLFMVGHWANTPTASTTELIKQTKAGGVIIMSAPEDPREIKNWIEEWSNVSSTTLLIAIDQEGGPVSRLRGPDFIETGQRSITTLEQALSVGVTRGAELRALGINMNFAPVLDSANSSSSFMYGRTFPTSENSAQLAQVMVDGFAKAGVIGVAKHFPGHDDTSEDSHSTLPTVDISKAELDLFTQPFREFISTQPRALMTAHVFFPQIDELPVTLSHFFLTDYLRGELGFKGVVITDDMSMDAIDSNWSTEDATILSLQAGADIILFAAESEKAVSAKQAVLRAIDAGTLSEADVTKHYQQVLRLK